MKTGAWAKRLKEFLHVIPNLAAGHDAKQQSPDLTPSTASSPPDSPLCSVEDIKFCGEKDTLFVPTHPPLLSASTLSISGALFCDLLEITQGA